MSAWWINRGLSFKVFSNIFRHILNAAKCWQWQVDASHCHEDTMQVQRFICEILRELIFPDLCDSIHACRTPTNILVTARTTRSGKTECGTRPLICQDRKRETRSLPINAFLWLTRHTQIHMHGHARADEKSINCFNCRNSYSFLTCSEPQRHHGSHSDWDCWSKRETTG